MAWRRWFGSLAVVVALASLPGVGRADGFIVVPTPTVVPPGHPPFAPLEVQSHRVRVAIREQVAITEVDQVFRNPGERRVEGDYWFPIPVNAAISRFSIEIDGKEQEAELVDAARARSIYEDIVRRMRDPALLEYGDRGAFRVRVFPIEPHATRRIKLAYTQVLARDGATVEYTYPLDTEKLSAAPIDVVSVEVHLASDTPIESVWSPSHTVEVKRKGPGEALVGFEQNHSRPSTSFRLFYTTTRDGLGLGVLTFREPGDDEGYFLLLASPGVLGANQRVLAKDVVFVVDTSGSMAGGKIEQLRRALTRAIDTLNGSDRFEIVRFSTEAEPFFGALTEANAANRDRARAFVTGFRPAGGTAIGEALTRAMTSASGRDPARPFVVVFVTDGLPTVGETDAAKLVAAVTGNTAAAGVRVFSFGVGDDVDTRFLDGLSEATRGRSQYVGARQDIEREVSSLSERIASPALTGLALRVDGDVRVSKVYPRELPDLFHGDQLVALGRFSGSGTARVVLEGMAGGEKRATSASADFGAASGAKTDYRFIPRLWATRRVGQLLDEIRRHGEQVELRDEIVSLARRYGIVTPYTSYLIVEDERRKDLPAPIASVPPASREEPSRDAMRSAFRALEGKVSGADAVAGARVTEGLKHAESLDQPAEIVNRVLGDAKADGAATAGNDVEAAFQASAAREPRHVAGKTFYANGSRWIDADVAEHPRDGRTQVEFASAAYFELVHRSPTVAAWLALGREVTVRIDDTIFEVVPRLD